jgi:hypothetical protein
VTAKKNLVQKKEGGMEGGGGGLGQEEAGKGAFFPARKFQS